MKIYTRSGDDGTTGLLYGGRVRKDHPGPTAYGDVDEAQAALGVVRAETERGSELAELATAPQNRHKLTAGTSLVTEDMVAALEPLIDEFTGRFEPPSEFVIPG